MAQAGGRYLSYLREQRGALRIVDSIDVDGALVRAEVEDVEGIDRRLALLLVTKDQVDPVG